MHSDIEASLNYVRDSVSKTKRERRGRKAKRREEVREGNGGRRR